VILRQSLRPEPSNINIPKNDAMASTVENHPSEVTAPGKEEAGQENGMTTDANEVIIEAEEV
jgi:hypothetical protein